MKETKAIAESLARAAQEGRVDEQPLMPGLMAEAAASSRLDGDTIALLPEGEPFEFELPVPPSVNNLFYHKPGGRYKTKAYENWTQAARAMFWAARIRARAPMPCRVIVTIHGGRGFSNSRDIDNVLKPILDFCVLFGVLKSDNVTFVTEAVARYDGRFKIKKVPARCVVRIEPVK